MEILIPGLILVALMVWASTKIKKTAAGAFEPELIETETFSLQKPEGFLHVIGDKEHAFMAYSRDYGKNDNLGSRQATIEIDVIPGDLAQARDSIERAAVSADLRTETEVGCELSTEETVNEIAISAVYKLVVVENAVYRLRFALLREHTSDYLRRIDETLDSFTVKAD